MANKDEVIGPASNSLSATLGSSLSPKAPTEHKRIEQMAGVLENEHPPSVFILRRGDVVYDTDRSVKVTVLHPNIGMSTTGVAFHEVANGKTGEKWIQWETNLKTGKYRKGG